MLRIPFIVLIALMSSAAMAGEGSMGVPDGADCPPGHSAEPEATASSASDRTAPARESKLTPDLHGDLPVSRSQSTRWHSFLPGMFR
ncbi:hypothetical protein INQ41_01565 [Lysobacter ciconiae]|uniref:Secreted protein n=2 Tax=Lysobacteraceae TaxID=32033 RepID=A0A7S6ZSG6_9GAMM|nr:hypothetical protein [Lysobacter ciconiae]QOW19790.1 hypothetical protein INQ41_01565 [Lysobacter ciconiae]